MTDKYAVTKLEIALRVMVGVWIFALLTLTVCLT